MSALAVVLLVFGIVGALAARSRFVVGQLWILAAFVVALLNLDAAVVRGGADRAVFPTRARAATGAHVPDRRALCLGLGAIAMFLVLLGAGDALGLAAWGASRTSPVCRLRGHCCWVSTSARCSSSRVPPAERASRSRRPPTAG